MSQFSQKDIDLLTRQGYSISTDKKLLDLEAVYNFMINESYWAQGLPEDRFKCAVENSMCFGVYLDSKATGFAGVVKDGATFAYLCDVFIVKEHRGKNVGKLLITHIVNHPQMQGLRRWSLATMDAHGLYAQFGFTQLGKPERWMERYTPYTI